jgi:hypothetical protein
MKTDNLQPETLASAEAQPDSPATYGSEVCDPKKAAFPVYRGSWSESGMHLRDYFAAATLPLAWQSEHASPTHGKEPSYRGVAERAYLMAHAMMVARENLPNADVSASGVNHQKP